MLHRERVYVNTDINAIGRNFFQICLENALLRIFVAFTLIAYPRLDFLKTFLTESILKILKFSSTTKHTPVTIFIVRSKAQGRSLIFFKMFAGN